MSSDLIVVKVGGSLFDLPDLGPRLQCWLRTVLSRNVVLVPGGGKVADAVRDLDRIHRLGEERSHWLALQALVVNARFLAILLPGSRVVAGAEADGGLQVLDAFRFAAADEQRLGRLPHRWDATSDSLAARAAVVAGASELVLLKSVDIPAGIDWHEAGRRGLVDLVFPEVIRQGLTVRAVNLRSLPAS